MSFDCFGEEEGVGKGGERGRKIEEKKGKKRNTLFPPPHFSILYLLELGLRCRFRSSGPDDLPERRGQALEHGPQGLEVARLVPERRGERRQAGRAHRLLRRGVVREQVAEPLGGLAAAFEGSRWVGERVCEGGDRGVGVEGCCFVVVVDDELEGRGGLRFFEFFGERPRSMVDRWVSFAPLFHARISRTVLASTAHGSAQTVEHP